MRALVKKEFRENGVVLAAAFVLLLALLEVGAYRRGWGLLFANLADMPNDQRVLHGRPLFAGQNDGPLPIGAWTVGCIGLALALACFQTFGEKVRHTWALLMHFPVRRGKMIHGKLAAGVLMYFALLGLLWGGLVLRLEVGRPYPGPFRGSAGLPLLWPLLAGVGVYLGAFASALRPARWYATKWLPLLVSVPGVALGQSSYHRWNPYVIHAYQRPYAYVTSDNSLTLHLAGGLVCLALMSLVLWMIYDQARKREF